MKKKYSAVVACIAILFTGCYVADPVYDPMIVDNARQQNNYYYVSSPAYSPLLDTKGSVDITTTFSLSKSFAGGTIQAATMATDNIGIMASFFGANSDELDSRYNQSSGIISKMHKVEAGVGYVKSLKQTILFEAYAGIAGGSYTNNHHTGNSRINNFMWFVQPAITYNAPSRKCQIGFISRFAGVNFKINRATYDTNREPFTNAQLQILREQPNHLMWEPAIIFRAGGNIIQVFSSFGLTANLTNSDLHQVNHNFTIGLSTRILSPRKK